MLERTLCMLVTERTAEEWVAGFAAGWQAPSDADSFCAHFDPFLDDEIRLVQPQIAPLTGKAAFREEFAGPLFDLLSDIRGTVGSWASTDQGELQVVFIELVIRARLAGGRPVALNTIDRITLRDGLAIERVANFDPLELLGPIALSPRSWPRFARMRLGL